MLPQLILYPAFALVLLTLAVWLTLLVARARQMLRYGIAPNDMPTRELADKKLGPAQTPNNNLMNLFELPVLFYVAILVIFQLHTIDHSYLLMTWSFVVLRIAHSLIQLTYNNVLHRGVAYLLSAGCLWILWLRIIWQVLTN